MKGKVIYFYLLTSYLHVFQWQTSGSMNAVRNSEDAAVFLDTSNTADRSSWLNCYIKYQNNQIAVADINTYISTDIIFWRRLSCLE